MWLKRAVTADPARMAPQPKSCYHVAVYRFSPRHKRNGVYFKHVPEAILQQRLGSYQTACFDHL